MSDNLLFRDRVAMSTPLPGLDEIRDLMELPDDMPLQPIDGSKPGESVRERWMKLSNVQRWAYIWKFRYMSADAAIDEGGGT